MRLAVGKVAAVGPTSAMILLRRIHAEAGHGRQPFNGVLMDAQQSR